MVGGTIIVEFEDVLFDTYKSELRYIQSRFTEFSAFMDYGEGYDLDRRQHKDPILDLVKTEDKSKFFNLIAINKRMAEFHESKDSYAQYLNMTNFGNHFFSSAGIIGTSRIDDIIVLYTYATEKEREVKESIWKDLNFDEKFKLVGLRGQVSVPGYLKKNSWNLFVSSSRNVIKALIEDKEFNIEKREFMVLNRPYSKLDVAEETLIEEKGATINYFK